jgi:carboxymethylenebutenolidase
MCEKDDKGIVPYSEVSRREFAALAMASAVVGMAGAAEAQAGVTEKNVTIKPPDGVCDAAVYAPGRAGPGVLVWPDIFGLRPASRDLGKRLAGQGYVALVANPFYRAGNEQQVTMKGAFSDPAVRASRMALRDALTDDAVDRDAKAFVAYLDALSETTNAKVGVQGYCMGGPLAFRTAAANPTRIGAVGSFHGGGLTTKAPNSPHLLIEKTNAQYLVAIAKNDDANDPTSKDVLKQTFAAAKKKAIVEVYGGDHGWCMPDGAVYNQAEAERAWAALTVLYKTALV